eukprot:SAG31_NODE_7010_length_1819_cov_1.044186_1_plen_60_part_00
METAQKLTGRSLLLGRPLAVRVTVATEQIKMHFAPHEVLPGGTVAENATGEIIWEQYAI